MTRKKRSHSPSPVPLMTAVRPRAYERDRNSCREHRQSSKALRQKIKLLERLVRRGGATLVMDPSTGAQITVFFNTKSIVY